MSHTKQKGWLRMGRHGCKYGALDTRIKASAATTMYDKTRVNAMDILTQKTD